MRTALTVLLLVLLVSGTGTATEPPRTLSWQDLVPESDTLKDPFGDRDEAFRDQISAVYRNRKDIEDGFIKKDSAEYTDVMALEAKLTSQGVDVEDAIRRIDEAIAAYDLLQSKTVAELDGVAVRIPGYALPLEFSQVGITEFLLVPYVGACIHTPPPPANQMVYVTIPEPFVMKNLFEPVWITGTIKTRSTSVALSYVDGQADIAVGYVLAGASIEPYQ
jgi:hypothetical protein